jgi:hypothetical protein
VTRLFHSHHLKEFAVTLQINVNGVDHPVDVEQLRRVVGFNLHFNTLAKTAIMGLYKR